VLVVVVEEEYTEVVCEGDCRELVTTVKTSTTCKKPNLRTRMYQRGLLYLCNSQRPTNSPRPDLKLVCMSFRSMPERFAQCFRGDRDSAGCRRGMCPRIPHP
jgi:hypothetical protein